MCCVAVASIQLHGKFTLVDLAGTERKKDSEQHSKERQIEGPSGWMLGGVFLIFSLEYIAYVRRVLNVTYG